MGFKVDFLRAFTALFALIQHAVMCDLDTLSVTLDNNVPPAVARSKGDECSPTSVDGVNNRKS